MHPELRAIDRINLTTVRLTTLHEDTELGHATGFFYHGYRDGKPNYWLVTNWHVLAGRNADDPRELMSKRGLIPTRLRMQMFLKDGDPAYAIRPGEKLLQEVAIVNIYDSNGNAAWTQHKLKNLVDVAVIDSVGQFGRYEIIGINEIEHQDIAIETGNEVFILGYPLGFSYFVGTPIWKRGSIASEPNLEEPQAKGRVVIDATTRHGMSGAPVIMRAKTHFISSTGEIREHKNATRWIGVYASRPALVPSPDATPDERTAEVGFFYRMHRVHETIVNGIPGPEYMHMP